MDAKKLNLVKLINKDIKIITKSGVLNSLSFRKKNDKNSGITSKVWGKISKNVELPKGGILIKEIKK